jgi:hypothetical protein
MTLEARQIAVQSWQGVEWFPLEAWGFVLRIAEDLTTVRSNAATITITP